MKKIAAAIVFVLVVVGGVAFSSWRSSYAVVTNAGSRPVVVHLETDIGESYPVGDLAVGRSAKVDITGRDKAVWAVAQFADDESKSSERLYTTSHITVSVVVTDRAVAISYAL